MPIDLKIKEFKLFNFILKCAPNIDCINEVFQNFLKSLTNILGGAKMVDELQGDQFLPYKFIERTFEC